MSKDEENTLPGTAWDVRVDQLMNENEFSLQSARDWVITDWLYKGDTRPFTDFVSQGHVPCIEIIKYLALMMNPLKGLKKSPPYILVIKSQGRKGRRPDPEIEMRSRLTAQRVEHLIKKGMSYENAIFDVAELLGEGLDSDIPSDTVEKDYKRYKSKSQR